MATLACLGLLCLAGALIIRLYFDLDAQTATIQQLERQVIDLKMDIAAALTDTDEVKAAIAMWQESARTWVTQAESWREAHDDQMHRARNSEMNVQDLTGQLAECRQQVAALGWQQVELQQQQVATQQKLEQQIVVNVDLFNTLNHVNARNAYYASLLRSQRSQGYLFLEKDRFRAFVNLN